MKIYKVNLTTNGGNSDGCEYFTVKKDALKRQAEQNKAQEIEGIEINEYEMKINKKDIMSFLNAYCSYPDNG